MSLFANFWSKKTAARFTWQRFKIAGWFLKPERSHKTIKKITDIHLTRVCGVHPHSKDKTTHRLISLNKSCKTPEIKGELRGNKHGGWGRRTRNSFCGLFLSEKRWHKKLHHGSYSVFCIYLIPVSVSVTSFPDCLPGISLKMIFPAITTIRASLRHREAVFSFF